MAIAGSIVLSACAQLSMKAGMLHTSRLGTTPDLSDTAAAIPVLMWLIAGFGCYGASLLAWLIALSRYPLSLAYPLLGISYVLVYVVAGAWPRPRRTPERGTHGRDCNDHGRRGAGCEIVLPVATAPTANTKPSAKSFSGAMTPVIVTAPRMLLTRLVPVRFGTALVDRRRNADRRLDGAGFAAVTVTGAVEASVGMVILARLRVRLRRQSERSASSCASSLPMEVSSSAARRRSFSTTAAGARSRNDGFASLARERLRSFPSLPI